jgi:hypothetical protein
MHAVVILAAACCCCCGRQEEDMAVDDMQEIEALAELGIAAGVLGVVSSGAIEHALS